MRRLSRPDPHPHRRIAHAVVIGEPDATETGSSGSEGGRAEKDQSNWNLAAWSTLPAARKYPVELKERAVAMVRELEKELGPGRGAIARVAAQLGVNPEALRYWVRQDQKGVRPSGERVEGSESEKGARFAEMERELRELRRANEILRLASAFFAREIDLRPPR